MIGDGSTEICNRMMGRYGEHWSFISLTPAVLLLQVSSGSGMKSDR
jgi:hypothetical protein